MNMGWFGNLILKFARKGNPVREVVESVGERVLPKAAIDAIDAADRLGVDKVIEKKLRGKPKPPRNRDARETP
jgi:hypothetical protein